MNTGRPLELPRRPVVVLGIAILFTTLYNRVDLLAVIIGLSADSPSPGLAVLTSNELSSNGHTRDTKYASRRRGERL